MPLPLEVRNRIKAFVDIFMDRAARGIAGLLLLLFVKMSIGVRGIALVTFAMAVPWVFLTVRAQHEYNRTIRRRLEARRLDLDGARIQVQDADTVHLLETTAAGGNPRQAAYAISLLADAPGYDATSLLGRLAVITRSEKGCLVVSREETDAVPASPIERVVDATGAGDLFAAGFLVGLSRGADNRTAARLGALAAAEVIQHLGARPEAPLKALAIRQWIRRMRSGSKRRALAARVAGAAGQGFGAGAALEDDDDCRRRRGVRGRRTHQGSRSRVSP